MRRTLMSSSSRMLHSWSGAVSTNVSQLKPGGANGYFDTLHEVMPEIAKLTDGAWASTKGVTSFGAFSSVPRTSSMLGLNLWKDVSTLEKVLPMAAPVREKLGQHLNTSVEPIVSYGKCDVMDYRVLKPSQTYQPAVLALSEFPTKPGAKDFLRKLLGDPEIMKQLTELNFGIAFQVVTYPSETSMLSYVIYKDFNDYNHFRSDANQQKLAAWYKDSGFLDVLTGAPVGRTVFPEAFVLVN